MDPVEPELPTAQRDARRAIVLTAMGDRGLLENESAMVEGPDAARKEALAWIREAGISGEVEPDEWKVLRRAVGVLDVQDMIDAIWRLEGAAVLLWALGLYELPPYDELVTPADLFDAVGYYDSEAARAVLANARLRSSEELRAYWKHATMTHWRFVNFRLRPNAIDFVRFSRGCWIGEFDIGRFRILQKGMAVGDKPIVKADPTEVRKYHSTATERHRAINWIIGNGGSGTYAQVDVST